ncbi:MAG: SHOCT domain-containing protein [Kosmotogaceae bacterium]
MHLGYFGTPGWCGNFFGTWGWFWPILGFTLITALIVGVILIIRNSNNRYRNNFHLAIEDNAENSSIRILNERYVKGEISHEEYHRMKKNIQQK